MKSTICRASDLPEGVKHAVNRWKKDTLGFEIFTLTSGQEKVINDFSNLEQIWNKF